MIIDFDKDLQGVSIELDSGMRRAFRTINSLSIVNEKTGKITVNESINKNIKQELLDFGVEKKSANEILKKLV